MKLRLLMIALSVCVICACKKKGKITGKVTSLFDGAPAEGVKLQANYSNGKYFNYKQGSLAPVFTDANGEFAFDGEFKSKKAFEYHLQLIQPFDFDTVANNLKTYIVAGYEGLDNTPIGQKLDKSSQFLEFVVVPACRIKIIVSDIAPFEDNTAVDIKVEDAAWLGAPSFSGIDGINTGYMLMPRRNGKINLSWTTSRNGVVNEYSGSFPVSPFEKRIIEIGY